jgi:hypothetical protein
MSAAAPISLPDEFNAASYFVDRHTAEGRDKMVAIECGATQVTFRELFERVNQVGNGLRNWEFGSRSVLLLLLRYARICCLFLRRTEDRSGSPAVHALDENRIGYSPSAIKLGSNLGPLSSEWDTKRRYKTQSRPKRTNHIALVSLPWAQGVRGSNPRAPTNHFFCTNKSWKRIRQHIVHLGALRNSFTASTSLV